MQLYVNNAEKVSTFAKLQNLSHAKFFSSIIDK